MKKIVPVILCGGSGSRLWPLSRIDTPKQFLKLMDNHTLLQKTALRTLDIVGKDSDIVLVTLNSMKMETIQQLQQIFPRLTRHLLGEPQARNTAAAVAFASLYVQRVFGDDSLIWILPADHYIGNESALSDALSLASQAAMDGKMATFGITPTRPETGYGYILKGKQHDNGIHIAEKFLEKPSHEIAQQIFSSGEYLWSSGMHLFKVSAVSENYKRHAPETWNTVERSLRESMDESKPSSIIYGMVKEEPFETAVMEKADNVVVVPCDPQWSDIGCWESLWEIRPKNENGNTTHGKVVCEETMDSMILAHDRLVTCVGLKDVVVIETADSVLVADKQCNGSLKKLVKTLQEKGHKETMASPGTFYHWGHSKILAETPQHKIHEMVIHPGQMHDSENTTLTGYWIIASGEALFMVDGNYQRLKEKESIFVPAKSICKVTNPGEADLRIFHFQCSIADDPAFTGHPGLPAETTASSSHMAA